MPKLSDSKIKQAKTEPKAYKLYDEDGLFVLVHPNESKYFRMRYYIGGKEKLLSLGVYGTMTLAEARDARDAARKLVKSGIDPVANKKEKARAAAAKASNSFESIARDWHAKKSKLWVADHAERVKIDLERDVFPLIGTKPITDITTPEVLAVIKGVEQRGSLDVAGRSKQRISSIFKYAIANSKATYNPAAQIESDALTTRKTQHRAYIARDELPEFLVRLEAYDGHLLTKLALKLVLLTFLRSGELRGALWSEFNFDRRDWRIPKERMKGGKEGHIVPLSRQALRVLDEIKKLTWDDMHGRLFPSQNGDGKVMSENTLLYALYRMGYHKRATVHGLRSTASTILNELGWRPDVIERQLAHMDSNKVRAAYNRAEYLPERKEMMQAWADYVDEAAEEGRKQMKK